MLYVGIDNGLNGGIVGINETQEVNLLVPMPIIKIKGKKVFDVKGIVNIVKTLDPKKTFVVLEKAAPRPVQGKRACFMTGGGYFLMQGILESFGIPYEIVTPQRWQKSLLKGLNANNTKEASILFCQRRFPDVDLTLTPRSKKPSDGLSDGLAMAVFCFRLNRGIN